MSVDGDIIITDIGHAKLNQAVRDGTSVLIAEVALGDGNGARYNPGFGQIELKRERARSAITRNHTGGEAVWRCTTEFAAATTPVFWVREIGFFDAEGDMILLWAGADIEDRQTGAVDYILDAVLALDRVRNGVIVIAAPSDELFDATVASALAITNLQVEQLRQAELLRRLFGTYQGGVA